MKWIHKRPSQALERRICFTLLKTVLSIAFPHCISLFFGQSMKRCSQIPADL